MIAPITAMVGRSRVVARSIARARWSRGYRLGASPRPTFVPRLWASQQFKHSVAADADDSSWGVSWLLGLAGGLLLLDNTRGTGVAHNCGIVGFVGEGDASELLLEGLTVLQNRGYDSAGLATISEDSELFISKFASRDTTADSIDLLKKNSSTHVGHHVGIAHTRWATHGGKTDANAHPHSDYKNRIAIAHNGTINNAWDLKSELRAKGIPFRSETDTEVIAQLIGVGLDEGLNLKDAVAKALNRCDGTWGLAVVSMTQPDEIVVACNGSPMTIGVGQGRTFIASETSAFSRHTKSFIAMKDGEIGIVRANETTLDTSRIEQAPHHEILSSPAPYPHFTIREALEQPEAIARALGYGGRMSNNRVVLGGMDRQRERLSQVHNLLITGCGTSLYAANFGARLMRELDCFDSVTVADSAEVGRATLPRRAGGLLAVSQSGETKDVHRGASEISTFVIHFESAAVVLSEEEGLVNMAVVNAVGSLIARTTGLGIYLYAGRENAVASTKAFTSQVTAMALMAIWFRQLREEENNLPALQTKMDLLDSLQRLPISFGMAQRTRERCRRVAEELVHKEHLFVLGKGYAEPIALEGALKIKEMSYLHAEGYSGGALKHGPFALIEGENGKHGPTPVIMLIFDDQHAERMRCAAEEVRARGAQVYVITDKPSLAKGLDDEPIVIPSNGILTPLIGVLPLQFIAYELALLRGINPDVPRNLAKAVTTD